MAELGICGFPKYDRGMKIEDQVAFEVMANRKNEGMTIVAICGAADLGKSYLGKSLVSSFKEQNLEASHLTMDTYLMDRTERKKRGLSGYHFAAYNQAKILEDLQHLNAGKSILFRQYDHNKGKTSGKTIELTTSDILVFDGLHTMHPSFALLINISFFLYTRDKQLKEIRREADLVKRNYSIEYSKKIAEREFSLYKKTIEPYKTKANYLLFLESKWRYKLMKID